MDTGTKVYLSWYDFGKKTENICKGEVVDNSLWDGTRWQGYVNVLFQPPHSAGPFCHHFLPERLSLTPDNVPHDDCYLICGRKSRAYEHDYTVKQQQPQRPSDSWQQVQRFKQDHWDYTHGHLATDALDEFYRLWHDAIAVKRAYTGPLTVNEMAAEVGAYLQEAVLTSLSATIEPKPQPVKLTAKQKRSTGRIRYTDATQTSIFD